jgi:hypothetical protein
VIVWFAEEGIGRLSKLRKVGEFKRTDQNDRHAHADRSGILPCARGGPIRLAAGPGLTAQAGPSISRIHFGACIAILVQRSLHALRENAASVGDLPFRAPQQSGMEIAVAKAIHFKENAS